MKAVKVLFIILISNYFLIAQQSLDWTPLFNNQNLENWEIKNGTAPYKIEGEEIVGISKMKTPNSFLCTKKMYGDFILELEVKVDSLLNSGIQIRSQSIPSYHEGTVHGYQVEIDPSPRAYTGGIYDESRRGWLYPLSRNEPGRKAFRQNQWNHLRIEAIGNDIRVWLNGVNTANIVDDLTSEGFIGLQVHSIWKPELKDKEVRWRNINIITTNLQQHRKEINHTVPEENFVANTLTKSEKQEGWRLLWDGKSSENWRSIKGDAFPKTGWNINEETLTVMPSEGMESIIPGGDIISKEKFQSFELKVEFKIAKGANSGIKYFIDPELNEEIGKSIGLEYQILDDQNHPDAKKGIKGNRTLASLYDLIPAENLSRPGHSIGFTGIGKWNQARIVVTDNRIEHWLNGYKTISYDRTEQAFKALIDHSKFADKNNFNQIKTGHILLQDHGNQVSFRSIKIKVLPK
ncbi:MAG: hypothetical protein ACI8YQ_000222 [Polaribacter sp.]|jgi:hypothetical protein